MDNCSLSTITTNLAASNCSSEPTRHSDFMSADVVKIVVSCIFGLVAVVGLLGNALVILVVILNKQMRNTTNVLILSLAIADLSFIVICVPFSAVEYVTGTWPFGLVWCKIVQYFIFVTANASIYTLVLMSLDRYLAVVRAASSLSYRTIRNAAIAVAAIWTVILVAHIPFLWVFIVAAHPESREPICINRHLFKLIMYSTNSSESQLAPIEAEVMMHVKLIYSFFFTFGYALPLIAVIALYGLMINRLRQAIGSQINARKKRVTRLVVVVVGIFALCWLPNHVIFLLQFNKNARETAAYFYTQIVANCLAYMNSCINPILYAFLSEVFRHAFIRALGCKRATLNQNKFQMELTTAQGAKAGEKLLNPSTTASGLLSVNNGADSQKRHSTVSFSQLELSRGSST